MTHKRIEYDADEFRRLWASDMSCREIGKRYGVSHNWASDTAKELGLPRRAVKRGDLPLYAMRVAYANGMTSDEIARSLRHKFPSLASATVRRWLKQAGDKLRPGKVRSKLNPAECVRLFRAGMTRTQIAQRFKVHTNRVSYAIRTILGAGTKGTGVRIDAVRMEALLKQGLNQRQVAREMGCHRCTVARYLRLRLRDRQQEQSA